MMSIWLFCLAMGGSAAVDAQSCKAENVILMIGDGMGLGHIAFLAYSEKDTINLEYFPVVGLQKTHSATDLVTDSGAAATAMACGIKTYNSAIGTTVDTTACEGLFEIAERQGISTGLVVTSSIVHATPAAFYAHQKLRGFHEGIADDLVNSGIEYIYGGGQIYFTNRYGDDRNLLEEMEDRGYYVSGYDRRSFKAFSARREPRMAYLTAYTEPLPVMQGREPLAHAVSHALNVLSTYATEGFILVVEGSQIDFATHSNNEEYLRSELRDFNEAIGVALHFAQKRDDTLVLVTGDHETGHLRVRNTVPGKKVHVEFLTKNHSHLMVPVFAYGPCAELFAGIYENTEIFSKTVSALGLASGR